MYFITVILLFGLWVFMSGQFDAFHLGLGVLSSLIVAALTHSFLFQDRSRGFAYRLGEGLRFLGYVLWLLKEIILANLHVLRLALHPRMHDLIDPKIIKFETSLKNDFSKFVFANSITLTPGTVTVQVNQSEFIVHAISHKMASGLPGEMEERVKRVFEPEDED